MRDSKGLTTMTVNDIKDRSDFREFSKKDVKAIEGSLRSNHGYEGLPLKAVYYADGELLCSMGSTKQLSYVDYL